MRTIISRLQHRLRSIPGGPRAIDAMRVIRRGLPALEDSVEGGSLSAEQYPAGHYYSAIPDFESLAGQKPDPFARPPNLPGVDLNLATQIELAHRFREMKEDPPSFAADRRIRFDIQNDAFTFDDAPVLNYMLRSLRPKRVIEVGSGYSSACMLDTNDLSLDGSIEFTFIDIDCTRLRSMLTDRDRAVTLIEQAVQDVDIEIFDSLEADDVLFIDSSHVAKIGSDVNYLLFHVLPRLRPGVVIHVHDVRYPFQYPRSLVLDQRVAWNEAYLLRAFLSFNSDFEIIFWLNCLLNLSPGSHAVLAEALPLDRFGPSPEDLRSGGGSIWLRQSDDRSADGSHIAREPN